ncbi:hypothetical protein EDB83DRAFT_2318778 [Lactarius deliciosus]|nr:hypothetical protein EDB83DRAFT_2318778 [Lactarius deliciosus]
MTANSRSAAWKTKAAMAMAVARLLDWCSVDWDLETNNEMKREIDDDINESEGTLYIQASRYTTHWRTRGRGKGECRSRVGTTSKEWRERRMNTNESKGDGHEYEKRKEQRGSRYYNGRLGILLQIQWRCTVKCGLRRRSVGG